jgi:glycosyltransferase involved in cell wall biosynthesis
MKKKVLLVGDYLNGTGFHRVVAHIKNALKNDFEIHHVGIAYNGDVFTPEEGITIYPATSDKGGQYGHKYIAKLIDQIQPDIFFIVYDIIFVRYLLEALRHKTKHMLRGAYLALDGEILKRRKMISPLKELDFCVWYTDFAHNHVQNILKEQRSLLSKSVDFSIIPHGVESNHFYPISQDSKEQRCIARKEIFPNLKNPDNTMIVLNANRPAPRKRIDLTLKAFAEFAKDKSSEDVKLYLHHSFKLEKFDHFTEQMIQDYDLQDYLLSSPLASEKDILTTEQLNLLYNACDVGINTCMGEGWGLVNFEHAATRAPQILPAHSCFPEIWKDSALWITSMEAEAVSFAPRQFYNINPYDAAKQLEILYRHPNIRQEFAQRAFENVTQEKYRWKVIESQWRQLFQAYVNSPKLQHKTVAMDAFIN